MRIGIVGLPQVGKTTIFRLLTQGRIDTSSWGGGRDAHIGVAYVPDEQLTRLAELTKPNKTTYASVEYVDLPGLSRGEGQAALQGRGKEMAIEYIATQDGTLTITSTDDPSDGNVIPGYLFVRFDQCVNPDAVAECSNLDGNTNSVSVDVLAGDLLYDDNAGYAP